MVITVNRYNMSTGHTDTQAAFAYTVATEAQTTLDAATAHAEHMNASYSADAFYYVGI